jgi:hypothetical protein
VKTMLVTKETVVAMLREAFNEGLRSAGGSHYARPEACELPWNESDTKAGTENFVEFKVAVRPLPQLLPPCGPNCEPERGLHGNCARG